MSDVNLMLRALSEKGNLEGVTTALGQEADVNSTTQHGMSALHFASMHGHGDIAAVLLKSKADPNIQNSNGQTPLELAAVRGHENVVSLLLEAGCDVNGRTKFSGMTALHLASKNSHKDVVKLLLSHDADQSILDEIKKPAVYYAGNEPTARLFRHPYDSRILRATMVDKTKDNGPIQTSLKQNKDILCAVPAEDESKREIDSSKLEEPDDKKPTDDKRGRNRVKTGPLTVQDNSPNKHQLDVSKVPSRDPSPRRTMEQKKDSSRSKGNHGTIKHEAKDFVTNHKVEYSEEHKKRMKMSVFDRLMGGKK